MANSAQEITQDKAIPSPENIYKQLFFDRIYAQELSYAQKLSEGEAVFEKIPDDIKIPFAVFLMTRYDSRKAKEYIKENSQKALHYLIDKNDWDSVSEVLEMIK